MSESLELREACSAFGRRLTVEEKAKLLPIRNEISRGLRWNKLGTYATNILTSILDAGVFRSSGKEDWIKPFLQAGFTSTEEKILFGSGRSELRQEYISLLLLAKLLGKMKQTVQGRLKEIEPFPTRMENDFFSEIEALLGGQTLTDDELLDTIDRTLSESPALPDPKPACSHKRTKTRYEKIKGATQVTTICKDCGEWLTKATTIKPKKHEHLPMWVKGKEGQEAICMDTKCGEIIPDPSIYDWVQAGLEPYGDDPSQDEVIILKSSQVPRPNTRLRTETA